MHSTPIENPRRYIAGISLVIGCACSNVCSSFPSIVEDIAPEEKVATMEYIGQIEGIERKDGWDSLRDIRLDVRNR